MMGSFCPYCGADVHIGECPEKKNALRVKKDLITDRNPDKDGLYFVQWKDLSGEQECDRLLDHFENGQWYHFNNINRFYKNRFIFIGFEEN